MIERDYGSSKNSYQEVDFSLEGNHFPIGRILLHNSTKESAVILVDRPCSGSVTPSGEIHIMMQRFNIAGDNKGLNEQVSEKRRISLNHVLIFGGYEVVMEQARSIQVMKT